MKKTLFIFLVIVMVLASCAGNRSGYKQTNPCLGKGRINHKAAY